MLYLVMKNSGLLCWVPPGGALSMKPALNITSTDVWLLKTTLQTTFHSGVGLLSEATVSTTFTITPKPSCLVKFPNVLQVCESWRNTLSNKALIACFISSNIMGVNELRDSSQTLEVRGLVVLHRERNSCSYIYMMDQNNSK